MTAPPCQRFEPGLWLFGAGGHAKVVIAALHSIGVTPAGVFDDDLDLVGTEVLGTRVIGPLPPPNTPAHPDARAVVAIGPNRVRKAIVARYPGLEWGTVVHRSAIVHETASLRPGAVVFANAVVQPHARIGSHAILNTGAQVDHDCDIGDYAHIGPGSCLGGGVRLSEGAFLGVGCAAAPYTLVGEWTTVGAGAAVVRDLPGGATAVGVPARVTKHHPSPS